MPRPKKTELREAISRSRVELSLGNPLMSAAEMDRLTAVAHKVSVSTVRYYLRTDSPVDRRYRYTPAERSLLASMSRAELLAYATRHNKNFNTLYSLIHRLKHSKACNAWEQEKHVAFCEERGYMDFGRAADLKAFSFPLDAFKDARKVVRGVQNMDLVAPNYLVHKPTKKFYILTRADQSFLLTNPARFLKERAAYISTHWRDGSQNMQKSHYLLVDTSTGTSVAIGTCISAHSTFEDAIIARREYDVKDPIQIVMRGGEMNGPTIHFDKGETVPLYSPDSIATVRYRESDNTYIIASVNRG